MFSVVHDITNLSELLTSSDRNDGQTRQIASAHEMRHAGPLRFVPVANTDPRRLEPRSAINSTTITARTAITINTHIQLSISNSLRLLP